MCRFVIKKGFKQGKNKNIEQIFLGQETNIRLCQVKAENIVYFLLLWSHKSLAEIGNWIYLCEKVRLERRRFGGGVVHVSSNNRWGDNVFDAFYSNLQIRYLVRNGIQTRGIISGI